MVFAHITLLYNAGFLVKITYVIGASRHAELAANANVGVNLYRAVFFFGGSAGWANLNARGVVAVLAREVEEVHINIRPVAALFARPWPHAYNARPIFANGLLVNNFTRNRAGMAP
jgi:hypothetical protein